MSLIRSAVVFLAGKLLFFASSNGRGAPLANVQFMRTSNLSQHGCYAPPVSSIAGWPLALGSSLSRALHFGFDSSFILLSRLRRTTLTDGCLQVSTSKGEVARGIRSWNRYHTPTILLVSYRAGQVGQSCFLQTNHLGASSEPKATRFEFLANMLPYSNTTSTARKDGRLRQWDAKAILLDGRVQLLKLCYC